MPSLTFSVNVEANFSSPHNFLLVATQEERVKIAKRLNILSVKFLEAQLTLEQKERLHLRGKIRADIIQQCVRSLKPLPSHLEIPVDELFIPPHDQERRDIELDIEDMAEPLPGNTLDLGEIVIQLLSLNLDPYPVDPSSAPIEYYDENGRASPFDMLKKKE
ncbi:MAG: DUF177 domain-containing protein [Alphaproteobacteria bacterium]|nr:DUF177 domain-containing protein [Alphaproteobacteria bacterium]